MSHEIHLIVEQEALRQLNQAQSLQLMNPHQILINTINTEMFIVVKQAALTMIVIIVVLQVHVGNHIVHRTVIAIVITIVMRDVMKNLVLDHVQDLDQKMKNIKEGL